MAADRSYVAENRAQLERLRALTEKLNDQQLARPMEAGWTVAGVLAHLAFWDERIVTLIDRWAGGRGTPPPAYDFEAAVDWINDAGKPLCLALPPRVAARLAVEAAVAADERVAGLSEAQLAANAAAGHPISVLRAEHRREHLDEIDQSLARG
jgi:Mycothiol maleylpyruvate isomerase N-terminal domain